MVKSMKNEMDLFFVVVELQCLEESCVISFDQGLLCIAKN